MRIAFLVKNFADGDELSEYVKSLAEYAVEKGHDAFIISFDDGSNYTVSNEVKVKRFRLNFDGDSLYSWAMIMNNEMKAHVMDELKGEIDLIHANDWTTVPGGVTLSKHLEKPLFITFHSTENMRGFQGENSGLISEMEWQGSFEADKVFANNEDAKNSLLFDLDLPNEKVEVVDPLQYAWQEKILNFYGEIVHEEVELEV